MSSDLSVYKNFFDNFNRLAINNTEKQIQKWQQFFDDYKKLNNHNLLLKQKQPVVFYDKDNAIKFFEKFSQCYEELQSMGYNFNIFELAGVKRDEVKISSILAWFLNPKASHGQRDLFLNAFLRLIPEQAWHNKNQPLDFKNYRVLTECYGDDKSRMDIVVDTNNFYLVIETKIDTGEHDKQLERYKEIAKARAGVTRSWALIYLTVHGKCSKHCADALPLKWSEIGESFKNALLKLLKQKNLPDNAPACLGCEHFCQYNAPVRLVCEHFCQFICNL